MKNLGIAVLLMMLVTADVESAETAKRLRFVFITTCVEEAFFAPVKKGMHDAAALMGVDCTFTGTVGVDLKAQAEMVRREVKSGCDGIALNIIDPTAFDAVVKEALDVGVPVVAFNVDDNTTPNGRLSAVCQHLYDAGRTLGLNFAAMIPAKSHILMTMHAKGVSALEDRLRGAQDIFRTNRVTWTVAITGNTSTEARDVIAVELRKHPDIKFVVCTGQADTEGAGLAIEKDFPERRIGVAGFDVSPEILRLIKKGAILFTIDQQPYLQGFYSVIQLTLYKRYGIMPADINTGATVIAGDKVDEVFKLSQQAYR